MSTKLTYTGAEVQELLDKIGKGDFDNAKTLEGHPASYFAVASELTSLAESFATEQGRINTLYSYFNNGSANDALSLGGQLPSYYATALQYEILQQTLTDFKSLFDSMFEKDSEGNIHAKLSLWSSGGITAGGVGSGGSGGGGGESYNRLDSWADYSADKAGYVLSALLGKDLDNRVSALANAGYITASALAPYALRSEIPSLVGYATQSWVGENYLSKSGGKLVYSGAQGIEAERTDGAPSHIMFIGLVNGTSRQLGGFGMNGYNDPVYVNPNGIRHKVLTAENYSDYALSKNGGTVNGSITASSFIGNLTGTADKASTQAVPYSKRDVNLWDIGDCTARYFALSDIVQITPSGVNTHGSILMEYSWDINAGFQMISSNAGNTLLYRSRWNGAFKDWREIAFTDSNVASATKLQTARTIWGQSFDGTGDITGPLHLGNNISIRCYSISGSKISTLILDPSNTLLLGYDMSNIGGTVLYGKALAMRYGTSRTMGFLLNEYGNVAIGGATADEKLHVHGNGKFTGALTVSSLTIGGATITYDSVNEALCINGNMYALGGITAGGAGISTYSSLEARVARLEQQLNI